MSTIEHRLELWAKQDNSDVLHLAETLRQDCREQVRRWDMLLVQAELDMMVSLTKEGK